MRRMRTLAAAISALCFTMTAFAADYTTLLTPERGFVEVTDLSGITDNSEDYYILTSAENTALIVGIGAYEGKPDWASTESKALRYRSADVDPVLTLSNFFSIEKSGGYVGLRNAVYSADLFQTHDNAGYMYVNTYTDKTLDEWSQLTPTFQDGYWMFESGKYPISGGDWASGYLGPWNKTAAEGEALALNRKNTADDAAGHFRLFRITKTDLRTLQRLALQSASASNPISATFLITNPSFETGDETGWTMINREDETNPEFTIRDYGMSNKDGLYLMNAFNWWAPNIGVTQTIDIPSGKYTLSAIVCTWDNRTVYFTGNDVNVNTTGMGDATGIPVSLDLSVGLNGKLVITAGSVAQWWIGGHEGEMQTFFKIDDVQLTCNELYLNGAALPLPNDKATMLEAGQWYYYDVNFATDYWLVGNINGLVYSTDGMKQLADISIANASREMSLSKGRYYFKSSRGDATLEIVPQREIVESENSFSAVALNVDGLPNTVAGITVNEDGPGSKGTKKISSYLAAKGYDMIGCSEDFNYNGSLMESLSANYTCGTIRATLSLTNLRIPFDTDGLNLVWKNATVNASGESWTRWNSSKSGEGNQFVKKGYRHYDVIIDGTSMDVYIMHMDAGGEDYATSREGQWRQLAEAINNADASRPKLIIGDTNSRWTREDIKTNFIDVLSTSLKASDVWVELFRDGAYPTTDMADLTDQTDPTDYTSYEIVDKIIYINPTAANTPQLVPQSFRIEQDYTYDTVDHDGNTNALGDHKPVVVDFKILTSGAEVASPIVRGDVNIDGSVTIADVTALVNIILGKDDKQPYQYDHDAADVNTDGRITIADVTALVNIILGK